ncbi:MAG: murein hydrolase activator EnvC family protein [Actinomycetota bacterium]
MITNLVPRRGWVAPFLACHLVLRLVVLRLVVLGLVVLGLVLGLVIGPATISLAASAESVSKDLDSVAAAYGKLETQLAQTEARQTKLQQEDQKAKAVLSSKGSALQQRARYMYKNGGTSSLLARLVTSPNISVFLRKAHYFSILGRSDARLVEGLTISQARADEIRNDLASTKARQRKVASDLRSERARLQAKYGEIKRQEETARRAAEARLKAGRVTKPVERRQLEATVKGEIPTKVGSVGKFPSFSLPIAGPTGFTDTWGAARSGGRRHQGTDVMAPCGARVVAVTSGSISRLMTGGAGGTMVYLKAGNGDEFFYAHLQSTATSQGKGVAAGELIGYNGNSGNARGGPCHVHFEWHPGGGAAVNPYSLLASAR